MSLKELQKTLRDARDLMNNDGSHWVQGKLKTRKNGEDAFCAVGGVCEALRARRGQTYKTLPAAARPAVVALANAIHQQALDDLTWKQPQYSWNAGRYRTILSPTKPRDVSLALSSVVGFNDSPGTKWEDIKNLFTRVAKSPSRFLPKDGS